MPFFYRRPCCGDLPGDKCPVEPSARTPLVGNDAAPPHLGPPREAVLAAWGILQDGKKALRLADDLLGVSEDCLQMLLVLEALGVDLGHGLGP